MIETNKRKLATTGFWANIFSWVILIVQIAYSGWAIMMVLQSGSLASQNILLVCSLWQFPLQEGSFLSFHSRPSAWVYHCCWN